MDVNGGFENELNASLSEKNERFAVRVCGNQYLPYFRSFAEDFAEDEGYINHGAVMLSSGGSNPGFVFAMEKDSKFYLQTICLTSKFAKSQGMKNLELGEFSEMLTQPIAVPAQPTQTDPMTEVRTQIDANPVSDMLKYAALVTVSMFAYTAYRSLAADTETPVFSPRSDL